MAQQLLYILIISAICIVWGLPVLLWLEKKKDAACQFDSRGGKLVFLFFAGLLTLSFFSSWLVLIAPLRFNFLLAGTLVLLAFLFLTFGARVKAVFAPSNRNERTNIVNVVFIISCVLLFTLLGTLQPVNIDTQLYHLQAIRWTNEYGTVPGLANLYPRLGLLSGWFNLTSLFYLPFFKHQNFTFLNITTCAWFLFLMVEKLNHYRRVYQSGPAQKALYIFFLLLILYFLYDWQLFRDTANSTSYDFIVTALSLMVIVFIAEQFVAGDRKPFSILPVIVALMIIPLKLSGLFVLLPAGYYLVYRGKRSAWLQSVVATILILAPLLIRNYITSGYPLYPATFALDSPSWQLPHEMAMKFREYVLYVNKFYNQQVGFIMNYKKTGSNWIPFWFQGILLRHKILLTMSLLSFGFIFYKPFSRVFAPGFKFFIFSLWLMMACWFFTAPDPRFAFGFLLLLSFLPLALIVVNFFNFTKVAGPILLLASAGGIFYAVRKFRGEKSEDRYLYSVADTVSPPVNTTNFDGIPFYVPERIGDNWNNRCFFTPLPCLCEPNSFIKMRGRRLKDGFIMLPKPDSVFVDSYNY